MGESLRKKQLHARASKGFKCAGATIAVDGTEDEMVRRDAWEFSHTLSMRPKLNAAMDMVRAEVKAGRLSWKISRRETAYQTVPVAKRI